MAQYRKKPVVIEATQYFPDNTTEIVGLIYTLGEAGMDYGSGIPGVQASISTLEGRMKVSVGDWIITGIAGEKYPCKDSIFRQTYDLVGAEKA